MAAMGLLLKASSFVVNRDSKPSLPLKWRRNPLLRTTTTQISLPSSMIKNSCSTTSGCFIQTIKCSSSNRGSDFRVQCVMNNSKKNCFKKEDQMEEEEEEHPFKEGFEEPVLKVLKAFTTPIVAAKLVDLLLTKYPALASSRTVIFFGVMLAYDLCRAIVSRRRIGDGRIQFSLGPVLGSIYLFLFPLMAVFGLGTIGTVTWGEEGNENTITHKIIGYMVKTIGYMVIFMGLFMVMLVGFGSGTLTWPRSEEGSVNTTDKQKKSTKLQAEMVNDVVDSALDSKDIEEVTEEVDKVLTELTGETAAQCPEEVRKERQKEPAQAARDAQEEDPIAKAQG